MTEQEGLIRVFTGSGVDANFLKSILEDNGIACIVRDTLMESTAAGWASGAPEDSNRVFVEEAQEQAAKEIVKEYIASRNKS